jgi:hypothetical protein
MNTKKSPLVPILTTLVVIAAVGVAVLAGLLVARVRFAADNTPGTTPTAIASVPQRTPAGGSPTRRPTLVPNTPVPTRPLPTAAALPPGDVPEPPAPPDFAGALLPTARDELSSRGSVSVYRIGARLNPANRSIEGRQIVRFTNTEGAPLNEVYFRLYPNAPFYGEGDLAVSDVTVEGATSATTLEVEDTALKVALPSPLPAGASVEIGMSFKVTVPDDGGGHGIFNAEDGVLALYNWHPVLAVYEDGAWLLNPATDKGDPTNTDVANYALTLLAPEAYTVVTSGLEAAEGAGAGVTRHTITAALARNLVLVASNRYKEVTGTVGEVGVSSYFVEGSEEGGRDTLDVAGRSLELFGREFGPYPYPELDVVQVALSGGAAGMESTGLIMIGSDYYDPKAANPLGGMGASLPGSEGLNILHFVTAHETAHQWWYGVVGSDAYRQPWLDEGLTNWSSALYMDRTHGDEAGLAARDLFIRIPYRLVLSEGDLRLDQPVDRFDMLEYSAVVYGKGALMYDVLRRDLGEERFAQFLRDYYSRHRFERAGGDDWREALAGAMGEAEAAEFYRKWVEGTGITEADLPPGGRLSEILGNMGNPRVLLRTPTAKPPVP